MQNIITNIFLFAAVQGLLLSLLLFFKKQNRHANRVLSVAIFCLSLDLINTYLVFTKFYINYPNTFGATVAFPFIYGPIFYLYTLLLTKKEEKFRSKFLLHFIPAILVHLYLSPFYLLSHTDKLIRINEFLTQFQIDLFLIGIFKPIHGIIYTVFSIGAIKNFDNKIKETYSNLDKLKLDWLRYLIASTMIVWGVVVLTVVATVVFFNAAEQNDVVIYLSISVMIYAIGYGALNQPQIFTDSELLIDTGDDKQKEKYEKSTLTEAEIEKSKKELLAIMQSKKLFLNSELTLTQLATELGITNHNLSEVINVGFNKNFYDFINSYRVDEFKERLKKPEFNHYSLLAIAFESGFSSKSSFNTIFKKYTNSTPSEYRKQIA